MNLKRRQFIEYIIIICIAIVLTYWITRDLDLIKNTFGQFIGVLSPFFIGFSIAYLLNNPVKMLVKRFKLKRNVAIGTVYITFIVLISGVLVILVPKLSNNIMNLIDDTTTWATTIPEWVKQFDFGPYESMLSSQMSRLTELLSNATNVILNNVVDVLITLTTALFNLILGIIISIYMLSDRDKLKINLTKLLRAIVGQSKTDATIAFLGAVDDIFNHFLAGLFVEAFIVGVLASISLAVMGIKYALILGLIIGLTNIIPYFGPFIGAVPAILTTLMYDPIKAIWVAIFIIVLQQIDGNVIGPRVMGNYIGLEPMWIILAISIGGSFGGLIGMILAIPMGAIVKLILTKWLSRRLKEDVLSLEHENEIEHDQ